MYLLILILGICVKVPGWFWAVYACIVIFKFLLWYEKERSKNAAK